MSVKRNQIILGSTSSNLDVVGSAVNHLGFYGYTHNNITMAFHLSNFVGRVWIEATLADNPTDEDWFRVSFTDDTSIIQYDLATTIVVPKQLAGTYTKIRAVVNRTYIQPTPSSNAVGQLNKILMVF